MSYLLPALLKKTITFKRLNNIIIKEHKKYRNVRQTILTRCTVENLEG